MTPKWKADQEREEQLRAVSQVIGLQINKQMDGIRARAYWLKALEGIPNEILAEALAMELSSNKYQEVPRCRCCCRR